MAKYIIFKKYTAFKSTIHPVLVKKNLRDTRDAGGINMDFPGMRISGPGYYQTFSREQNYYVIQQEFSISIGYIL